MSPSSRSRIYLEPGYTGSNSVGGLYSKIPDQGSPQWSNEKPRKSFDLNMIQPNRGFDNGYITNIIKIISGSRFLKIGQLKAKKIL